MIKALLFDVDGVLVDSEGISIQIGIEFFRKKGIMLERADFAPFLGGGEALFFEGVAESKGVHINLAEASAFFSSRYPEFLSQMDIALPGAKEMISAALASHLLIGIVSSAPEEKVQRNLKALGYSKEDFDVVITGKDIKRNKPNPDIYLSASIALGVDMKECVVFEDSVVGVQAGKNAGMFVVGLMTTVDAETIALAGADHVVSTLAAFMPFSTPEGLELQLDEEDGKANPDAELYGVHYIVPLLRRIPMSVIKRNMIEMALKTREHALASYSKFKVGAAILSARTGRIYTGCNIENSSFGATVCAERNAIFHAISEEGAIGIDLLVVVTDENPPSPPCALCLQVLAEYVKSDTPILLVDLKGNEVEYRFGELLPHPFILKS